MSYYPALHGPYQYHYVCPSLDPSNLPAGANRRPVPGERLFVILPLDDGNSYAIATGETYQLSVGNDDGEVYVEVVYYLDGHESEILETALQEDTFFWAQDAKDEARRRVEEKIKNKEGEPND